ERHEGPALLETYTVKYRRDGTPDYGLAVCRTPQGARFVARVPGSDERTIAALVGDGGGWVEPIGQEGVAIAHGAEDFCEWRLG
ncbi:MAG TPA: hypothetical protein VFF94_16970, partial [Novosphingobium sp.]|nr:hypothetical protein [Novosphingobium sp.]